MVYHLLHFEEGEDHPLPMQKGENVQLYKENVHNLQLVRDLHQDQFNQLIRQYCHGKEKDVRLLGIQVILEKREPQPKVVEQN